MLILVGEVQFWGHIIDKRWNFCRPNKSRSNHELGTTKDPTEVKSLLRLAGYYRCFIQDFLKIFKDSRTTN